MKSEQELYSLPTFGKKEGKNRFFRSGPLVRVNLEPLKGAMVNCDGVFATSDLISSPFTTTAGARFVASLLAAIS
jgi:hypothetical protein